MVITGEKKAGWGKTKDVNTWSGVTEKDGHVTDLNLFNKRVTFLSEKNWQSF